jgi:DNA-binding transcriptional regulator YhcF (GntR family)
MSLLGTIDSTFTTSQRDLFVSGFVAEIGANAFAVWHAIKVYADFNTGKAFPGMRRLGIDVGMSAATVKRAVDVLEANKMLRIVENHTKKKGQTYIARERLSIRFGDILICTIVVDYIPAKIKDKLRNIKEALKVGESSGDLYAQVEIIPAPGFLFDQTTGSFKSEIAVKKPVQQQSKQKAPRRTLKETLEDLNSTSVSPVKHEN